MEVNDLLKDIFNMEYTILKEIQTGLRCETYLIESKGKKYIFQIYMNNTIYQAEKKYNILKLFNEETIPKVYDFKVTDAYSYLITEYKDGETLSNTFKNQGFSLENTEIADRFAYTLAQIHSIKKEKIFGWITDKTIFENILLSDYIKSEYNRLRGTLEDLESTLKNQILAKVETAIKVIEEKSKDVFTSVLCWYDINPDNILVSSINDSYSLSGFLDPGGARYGVEEWDLAFVKMELCRNEKEFISILNSYSKYNNKEIDMELLTALSVIVELDDISIRLVDQILLPIPYDSNFKDEIQIIEEKIKKTN